MDTQRIALAGMLTAVSMIFSYIEAIIPFSVGIWGIKLGLANLIVLSGLYLLPHRDVFLISITRILLSTFLFGNIMALGYSLAGGALSFGVMSWLQRKKLLSVVAISVAGGVCHNIGQIFVAYLFLESSGVFMYLPVLMVSGIVSGLVIGIVSDRLLHIWKKKFF